MYEHVGFFFLQARGDKMRCGLAERGCRLLRDCQRGIADDTFLCNLRPGDMTQGLFSCQPYLLV